MATLSYIIMIITATSSAPTTLFPVPSNGSIIPITGATGFQLCRKLNLAGCGANSINDLTRLYVDSQVQTLGYNYSLPFDPCDFDTINMTWILSIADLSLLSLVTADDVLNEMPCEIYIQMPADFLSDRSLSDIITDQYWFGPTGQCIYNASNILDCSDPNRTINNYTVSLQDECLYPFVHSNYKTDIAELYEAGIEHCGLSCDYVAYGGDINKLDDFNYVCVVISFIFGVGFFINISFELRKAYKGKTKWSELPLTFDIPVIISIWILILTIIIGVASWEGKEYFSCEKGTNAKVENIRRDNMGCYVAGQFNMLAIESIYFYCSLLAFSIWRSLANPFKPLFGFHKIWYHIALNIVVLGYYIGALVEDIFGSNPITGFCGPNVIGDLGMRYLFIPLVFDISTFSFFTSLSIYKLWMHFKHQQKYSVAEKAIVHLTIRMVIYSVFIAASLLCFLYMSIRFLVDGTEWAAHIKDNVQCLLENAYFGKNDECELVLIIEDDVYWTSGFTILLVNVASFVLSCSNSRYSDYSKMKNKARITTASTLKKLRKMGSVGSEERSKSSNQNERKSTKEIVDESTMHSVTSGDAAKNNSVVELTMQNDTYAEIDAVSSTSMGQHEFSVE